MMKPETLRLMNYYQSRFNNKVDKLISRSISQKGPYNSNYSNSHKPDTGDSLTVSRQKLGDNTNRDEPAVRVSEEPNLASPLMGRETNMSRFAGPAGEAGNPAISVLSGAENDAESVVEQHQKMIA